jgi:uncharacterized lipoprotein
VTARSWIAALAAVTVLAGCSVGGNVETKTEDDVRKVVQQYADEVKAITGGEWTMQSPTAMPCTGKLGESSDDVFTVQGAYQVPLAADKQLSTLAQIREQWKAKGWNITADEQIGDNRGKLAGSTGDGGYELTLTTVKDPNWLGILVHSPCYKSPTPRN